MGNSDDSDSGVDRVKGEMEWWMIDVLEFLSKNRMSTSLDEHRR
jgi:hypothetical protein